MYGKHKTKDTQVPHHRPHGALRLGGPRNRGCVPPLRLAALRKAPASASSKTACCNGNVAALPSWKNWRHRKLRRGSVTCATARKRVEKSFAQQGHLASAPISSRQSLRRPCLARECWDNPLADLGIFPHSSHTNSAPSSKQTHGVLPSKAS